MRYTSPPEWFLEPPTARILRVAARERLNDLQLDEQNLITDLCCKAVGAKVRPFDGRKYAADAADYASDKLQALRNFGAYIEDEWRALADFADEFIAFHRSVHDLLKTFNLGEVPGSDHLVKAVRVVKWLRHMDEYNRQGTSSRYLDPLAALLAALGRAQEVSERDKQFLSAFLDEESEEDAIEMFILELTVREVNLEEMFRVARTLDEITELDAHHSAPTPHHDGEDVTLRDIENLGEIARVGQQALSLPRRLMLYRAISGELSVREPVTHREKKQLLYFLVDGTMSMQGDAAGRAAGVVLNRLEAVINGDAEIYLRIFDAELREDEYHADSLASAMALMDIITSPLTYIGSRTAFEQPLSATSDRVKELVRAGGLKDEEIFLVTDGVAGIPDVSILGGTKLNVVQVGNVEVERLSALAVQSGGIAIIADRERVEKN